MLTEEDIEMLRGMCQGRINAIKADKVLDHHEREGLVRRYETIMHRLGNPELLVVLSVASVVDGN